MQATANINQTVQITALAKKIIGVYSGSFTIVAMESSEVPAFAVGNDGPDRFVAVGAFARLVEGQHFELTGKWSKHAKYGWRFQMEAYAEHIPTDNNAMVKYLSCGLFKGIGPKTAELIVARFGERTLEVIKNEPHLLAGIKGVSAGKTDVIAQAYKDYEHLDKLMLMLKPYDITNRKVAKIYKKYGETSLDILKQNPYRLCDEVDGFGFKTADQIARACDISFNDPFRLRAGILFILGEAAQKDGHLFLTRRSLLLRLKKILNTETEEIAKEDILVVLDNIGAAGDVVIEDGDIYLPIFNAAENYCATKLTRMMKMRPEPFRYDISETVAQLEVANKIKYAPKQKEAMFASENNQVLVVTGGPGVGKTTIIRAIIQIYRKNFPSNTIKLVAPTGRAAKRMFESTGVPAKTIHRELGFKYSEDDRLVCDRDESNPIEADLIIVDESSMLDMLLFSKFLKAIDSHTRVIFVGDADQLPSVGAGNVFRDLIDSQKVPVVMLNEIFRQANTSRIIINASMINQGDHRLEWGDDFQFIREDDDSKIPGVIRDTVVKELAKTGDVNKVQVLSAFRQRVSTGVDNLNQLLQEAINPKKPFSGIDMYFGKKTFRENDKVMQFRNDYNKDVFNGDIGSIACVRRNPDGEHFADIDINDQRIEYPQEDFEDLDLAYATTIHKSQGSEYEVVIIPVTTQQYIFLQRNMIYTAITRARKKVILVGTPKALAIAIKTNSVTERNSKLKERIQ